MKRSICVEFQQIKAIKAQSSLLLAHYHIFKGIEELSEARAKNSTIIHWNESRVWSAGDIETREH